MDPVLATLLLYAWAGLGAMAHWAKQRARGQTADSLFDHLGEHFGHTLLSLGATLGGVSYYVAQMVAQGVSLDGSPQSMALAFLTGYASDSALNKGGD